MRRVLLTLVACAALAFASPAEGQRKPKHKDPVLEQYLIEEFAKLHARLNQMDTRVSTLESEVGRVSQQQAENQTELRNAHSTVKAADTTLTNLRINTGQDLASLKTDLTQLRQDLVRMGELVTRLAAVQQPAAPAPQPVPSVEGYITAVGESGMTISLGSSAGIHVGMRLNVFRAADPRTQIGVIEVVEVLDANNSRATVFLARPEARFEFSDIVRPS